MRFLRSPGGVTLVLLAALLLLALGGVALRVSSLTSPAPAGEGLQPDGVVIRAEEVSFPASDGLLLRGWWMGGDDAHPTVILCHDRGADRASLATLALALNARGLSVLAFDFRGHGASAAQRSSLGLTEKRDVIGAVDFLGGRRPRGAARLGAYGVGMGAHAIVLAAADRRELAVLALDGLYPDVPYRLVRETYAGWAFGVEHLGAVPSAIFDLLSSVPAGPRRAADVLPALSGRDVLLLAPEGDPALRDEIERMYRALPEQPDVDGNLVVLPALRGHGLYGGALERYEARVVEFFVQRLVRTPQAA